MSVIKVGQDSVQIGGDRHDPYGLPVQDSTPRKDHVNGPQPLNRSRTLIGGIRVPNLRDLDSKYAGKGKPSSCRFDIVERVETIIKPGSFGTLEPKQSVATIKFDKSKDQGFQKMMMNRQPTFHAPSPRTVEDKYVVDRLGPYHWNQWVKHGRDRDARDVLYRNTYCLEREELRFRSMTLPRISQDKTLTIETQDANKSVVEKPEGDHDHVIVPKQPRGTVVRFREYMRPATYGGESRSLEIKRFKSPGSKMNHFTAIRHGFPTIRQDSRQSSRQSERPLKCENPRYTTKSSKGTLFNKHIYPAYKNAFNRDYSSADTFREYLESLQNSGIMKPNYEAISRESTQYDRPKSLDYENHVLQSVQEVNQPTVQDTNSTETPHIEETNNIGIVKDTRSQITVEIKPSWAMDQEEQSTPRDVPDGAGNLDNISSVHGSIVNKADNSILPKTSTVIEEGSRSLPGSGDNGSLCPTNTPTPDD